MIFGSPEKNDLLKKLAQNAKKWPKNGQNWAFFGDFGPISSKPLAQIAPKFLGFYSGISPFCGLVDSITWAHGSGQ